MKTTCVSFNAKSKIYAALLSLNYIPFVLVGNVFYFAVSSYASVESVSKWAKCERLSAKTKPFTFFVKKEQKGCR